MNRCSALVVGEILYDVFPGYERIGGAPFNVAYHLHKLGTSVSFISRIGKDEMGRKIETLLDLMNFDVRHIQKDDRHPTGRVMVSLDETGQPTFEIVPDMAYDHIDFDTGILETLRAKPALIYFGTLAQRTAHGHQTIQKILAAKHPDTRCLYDVNLRPDCYSEHIVKAALPHCNVLKMNTDELRVIKSMLHFSGSDRAFIEALMQDYDIDVISLTKGNAGSALLTATGFHELENTPLDISGDTVGAGDAYASIVAIGYLLNWGPERILQTATTLARRICTIKGAIPTETAFYDGLLDCARGAA